MDTFDIKKVRKVLYGGKVGEFVFAGKHHEIYLSDPRKVEAARLKTVLRQPVVNAT